MRNRRSEAQICLLNSPIGRILMKIYHLLLNYACPSLCGSCDSPISTNTAKMAMEPLRRKNPPQTHLHHHNHYRTSGDPRITKHQSITSQPTSISNSVPFSIIRYCARIATRSGLKTVFSPSAKSADQEQRTNRRPIHSVWYGHATTTPNVALPFSKIYDNKPVHEFGIEQFEKATVVTITPLMPCDLRGRDTESRLRRLKEIPVTIVPSDEDFDWREPADGEEVSGEEHA